MNRIIWVVAEVLFGLVGMTQKKIMALEHSPLSDTSVEGLVERPEEEIKSKTVSDENS